MKILIITQNDNLYLPRVISDLVSKLNVENEVVASIILDVSPFGKKESMLRQAFRILKIFGYIFFIRYSLLFLINKLRRQSVLHALNSANVTILKLTGSINTDDNIKLLKNTGAELLISVAANEIFRENLYGQFKYGCINLHTALLPKYRGLMPSFWVLKNNEKYTGVSVFQVDSGIDSGPIILQEKVEIGSDTQKTLIEKTKKIGVELIIRAVDKIKHGEVVYIPNSDTNATYFRTPTRQDVEQFYSNGKRFF